MYKRQGYAIYSFRRERRQRQAERAAYVEQLTTMRRDMVAAQRAQRQFYSYTCLLYTSRCV